MTGIGDWAFSGTAPGNRLVPHHIIIPNSVISIGDSAFLEADILITVKANDPPTLHENAFGSYRNQIDVVVPKDKRQVYLDNEWTGFRSISDGSTLTIGGPEKDGFMIYPNPARDKVHIDLGSGQELKQVNIHTMTGAHLYSKNGPEINTGHLSRGMYLFEIVTKTGDRFIKKVTVQ